MLPHKLIWVNLSPKKNKKTREQLAATVMLYYSKRPAIQHKFDLVPENVTRNRIMKSLIESKFVKFGSCFSLTGALLNVVSVFV